MHFKLIIAFVEDTETEAVREASRKAEATPAPIAADREVIGIVGLPDLTIKGRMPDLRFNLR